MLLPVVDLGLSRLGLELISAWFTVYSGLVMHGKVRVNPHRTPSNLEGDQGQKRRLRGTGRVGLMFTEGSRLLLGFIQVWSWIHSRLSCGLGLVEGFSGWFRFKVRWDDNFNLKEQTNSVGAPSELYT